MRVHYLQHVPFEDLASIQPWLSAQGHSISATRLFAGEIPPGAQTFDWLIVMGGPMGVHDEAEHPWLVGEKRCIEDALAANKALLGICLGAQLIAQVLGAKVDKNPQPEIGWFDVERIVDGRQTAFAQSLPKRFSAFHWHGDCFDIPHGAAQLARSEACAQQAFAYGDKVLGLQFHLEATHESARALTENCADELTGGVWIQSAAEMLARPERFDQANGLMADLLLTYSARI